VLKANKQNPQANDQTPRNSTLGLFVSHLRDQESPAQGGLPTRIVATEREALLSGISVRVRDLMHNHKYVSFDLDDTGRAIHLSKTEEGCLLHLVTPGTLPNGTRYSSIDERLFVHPKLGTPPCDTVTDVDVIIQRANSILEELERFMERRSSRPMIVNVSPQGFHENHPHRLVLGLTDTGGQDRYVNDSAMSAAQKGCVVINVNRAGPNHPEHNDVRCGMHYSYVGVDLLFVADESPDRFVAKEDMYPRMHWQQSLPRNDHVFFPLAKSLVSHLRDEPQILLGKAVVIGHYADGGSVALHCKELLRKVGIVPPKIWYNAHSLGDLKKNSLLAAGKIVSDTLRFPERMKVEQHLYDQVDGVLSTSGAMSASMRDFYNREPDFLLTPGIDDQTFYPRRQGQERSDPKYNDLWKELASTSNRTGAELQNAQLVMEISRTAETKGKDTVLRAFAECLKTDANKFLIINIADPAKPNLSGEELELGRSLRALIDELGIKERVILRNDWSPPLVALMHQVVDVFITGASSEPWGMSAQQAAACKQPIVSTYSVPSVTEVLMGEKVFLQGGYSTPGSEFSIGTGAICFKAGDSGSAAAAVQYYLDHPENAQLRAGNAYDLTIPRFTWARLMREFLETGCGFSFDAQGLAIPILPKDYSGPCFPESWKK